MARKSFAIDDGQKENDHGEKTVLEQLPVEPEDLQRWIIPREDVDLPADIYGDDVLFIDDGYDRSKLNMPGLLHLEVAVKCSRESSSGRPSRGLSDDFASDCESSGRPSGLGSGVSRALTEEASSGRSSGLDSGIGAEASKQPAAAAPAAEQTVPPSSSAPPPGIHAGEEFGAGQHARPAAPT